MQYLGKLLQLWQPYSNLYSFSNQGAREPMIKNPLTKELREFWDCDTLEEARDTRITVPAQPEVWNDELQYRVNEHLVRGLEGHVFLDFGCGAGRITRQLLRMGKEVHAVDVSEKMLEFCHQHCEGLIGLSTYLSDGYCFNVADNIIDCVVSCYVWQHMPTWEMIESNLREIDRVCKPGAYVRLQSRTNETEVNGVNFVGIRQYPIDYIQLVPWKHLDTVEMAHHCWTVTFQK